jgi:hypothetical protein
MTVTIRASADASAEGLGAPFAGGQVAQAGFWVRWTDGYAVFEHQLHV